MDLRSKNFWKSVESTTTSQRFNMGVIAVHQCPRDGMMVIVKPKMDVALGETGWVDGSHADLLAPKFHATKSHVFNKRFKVLEGFQVFWLSHAVTLSLQMWEIVQSM